MKSTTYVHSDRDGKTSWLCRSWAEASTEALESSVWYLAIALVLIGCVVMDSVDRATNRVVYDVRIAFIAPCVIHVAKTVFRLRVPTPATTRRAVIGRLWCALIVGIVILALLWEATANLASVAVTLALAAALLGRCARGLF